MHTYVNGNTLFRNDHAGAHIQSIEQLCEQTNSRIATHNTRNDRHAPLTSRVGSHFSNSGKLQFSSFGEFLGVGLSHLLSLAFAAGATTGFVTLEHLDHPARFFIESFPVVGVVQTVAIQPQHDPDPLLVFLSGRGHHQVINALVARVAWARKQTEYACSPETCLYAHIGRGVCKGMIDNYISAHIM